MQQQSKKNTSQQGSSKPQGGQPQYGSNVWDLNEMRKGTEAWNRAWTDMLAHNGNSEKWNQTFNQGNKNISGWMSAWNQYTTTCSDACTEYTQAYMQKCTEGQNQAYSYVNECSATANKAYGQYNQMFQNAFNCKTYDQCASWLENFASATQKITADAYADAAQAGLDCQERLGQPLVRQAFNWQERCWKAWSKYAKAACNF